MLQCVQGPVFLFDLRINTAAVHMKPGSTYLGKMLPRVPHISKKE